GAAVATEPAGQGDDGRAWRVGHEGAGLGGVRTAATGDRREDATGATTATTATAAGATASGAGTAALAAATGRGPATRRATGTGTGTGRARAHRATRHRVGRRVLRHLVAAGEPGAERQRGRVGRLRGDRSGRPDRARVRLGQTVVHLDCGQGED